MQHEIDQIAKDLKKHLKTLEAVGNGTFKNMDPEKYPQFSGIHTDLNGAFKAARSGNVKKLNELAEKYANTNRNI